MNSRRRPRRLWRRRIPRMISLSRRLQSDCGSPPPGGVGELGEFCTLMER